MSQKPYQLFVEPLETRRLLAGDLSAVSLQAGNLDIVLNLGPGIAGNAAAISALERAAGFWESTIRDPVQVHVDVDFNAPQGGTENSLASANSAFASYFYPDVRQRLINDADADESIVERLPTPESLEFLVPDGIQIRDPLGNAPVIRLTTANAKALGFTDPNVPASQFTAGGFADATISFSNDVNFDFDSSNGISPRAFDFEGVALHEIGHALGVVSAVDSVDTLLASGIGGNVDPTVPDLFRLAPGQGSQFSTAPRLLITGGNFRLHAFHDGEFDVGAFANIIPQLETGDIPFSSGTELGDGQQASHFKDDARTGEFIGILDPTLGPGNVGRATATDLRVLGLIGWDIAPQVFAATATSSLAASNALSGREITGTVSEPDARIFVRVPEVHGTNTVSATAQLTAGVGRFSIANDNRSEANVEAVQIILPGVGGGSGANLATPFFDPTSDFSPIQGTGTTGLISPEAGDISPFSKSTELLFSDFEPGESFEFSIGLGLNLTTSTFVGTQVIIDFSNGVRETATLSMRGATASATIRSEHYEQAINQNDGTWTLANDRFAELAAGTHAIQGVTVDNNGTPTVFEGEFRRIAPWQNPVNRLDVDGNSVISPLDALLIINRLESGLPLTTLGNSEEVPPPFFDVDGSNVISPIDVLTVINALNANTAQSVRAVQRFSPPPFDFATTDASDRDRAFRDMTDFRDAMSLVFGAEEETD